MQTEGITAPCGVRPASAVLLWQRLAATALVITGNAWVSYEYKNFWSMVDYVLPMVIGGQINFPWVTALAYQCELWPVVVASTGSIAAIIYVWSAAQRIFSVILATVAAAALCSGIAVTLQVACRGAWDWYAGRQ